METDWLPHITLTISTYLQGNTVVTWTTASNTIPVWEMAFGLFRYICQTINIICPKMGENSISSRNIFSLQWVYISMYSSDKAVIFLTSMKLLKWTFLKSICWILHYCHFTLFHFELFILIYYYYFIWPWWLILCIYQCHFYILSLHLCKFHYFKLLTFTIDILTLQTAVVLFFTVNHQDSIFIWFLINNMSTIE